MRYAGTVLAMACPTPVLRFIEVGWRVRWSFPPSSAKEATRYCRPQIQQWWFGTLGGTRTPNLLIRRMLADFEPGEDHFESARTVLNALVSPHSECRSRNKFAEIRGEFKASDTLTGARQHNAIGTVSLDLPESLIVFADC